MASRISLLLAFLSLLLVAPSVSAQGPCGQSLQDRVNQATPGAYIDVPGCTYHETVFIGKSITLDGHNRSIIDGDNARDRWIWIGSSNVTIKNFTMRNTKQGVQVGSIGTQAGISNVVIDRNDLSGASGGSLIGIGGTTNSKITNNQLHGGGQLGIGTFQNTGLVIQGNHIYGNNTAGVDPFWEAGGIKAINETNGQIVGNEVDHNVGPGIWCDIACNGMLIANNNVHDQGWNPIFYEISSNAEITGNMISASSNTSSGGNWGCITVATAVDVRVHDNACTDTLPLRAQLDNRADAPPDAGTKIRLENNRVIRPVPNQATSWWQYDQNGPLVPGKNGNVDAGNTLGISAPTAVPTPVPVPTVTCEVEVWLNGASQGRRLC